MRSICVFCGSSPGNRPEYMDLARDDRSPRSPSGSSRLVYGGGSKSG